MIRQGLQGLTDGWQYASMPDFWGTRDIVWQILSYVVGIVYLGFMVIFFIRCYLIPKQVIRELQHPLFRYSAYIIITEPLLLITVIQPYYPLMSEVIMWVCGPLIMAVSIHIIKVRH